MLLEKKYLKTSEYAKLMDMSQRTVIRLFHEGKLAGYQNTDTKTIRVLNPNYENDMTFEGLQDFVFNNVTYPLNNYLAFVIKEPSFTKLWHKMSNKVSLTAELLMLAYQDKQYHSFADEWQAIMQIPVDVLANRVLVLVKNYESSKIDQRMSTRLLLLDKSCRNLEAELPVICKLLKSLCESNLLVEKLLKQ